MNNNTIRDAIPSDLDALLHVAAASGLFEQEELPGLRESICEYFNDSKPGHRWLVDDDGGVLSAAYFAPEVFTEGTWNLYFLATVSGEQGGGRGGRLLDHVESILRATGARILIIETTNLDAQSVARRFYERKGFRLESTIREFYADGVDKLTYWKKL